MNKTISFTISGMIFHVEDIAYTRLEAWLAAVRKHFLMYDDSNEILQDIENRIAEILTDRSDGGKRPVGMADIDDVIHQIGTVRDFEYFDTENEDEPVSSTATPKKLYRDPDNSILGGVAAGVATHLNIDVTLTRILFVIFALIWGASIFIYFVLWLVMPVADTPAKKLEMKGEPITLASIEERIREKTPSNEEVNTSIGRFLNRCADVIRDLGEAIISILRKMGPVLVAVTGYVLAAIGIAAMIMLTVTYIAMLTNMTWVGHSFFPPHFPFGPLIMLMFLTTVLLLLAIPAILIILAGIALIRSNNNERRSKVPIVILSIWIIIVLIASALAGFLIIA
ncbi:MAG: PspC domain-containing protein [Balneolaceae bacterium]